MQCTRYTLGQYKDSSGLLNEFSVWSNGELFGDVEMLDTVFQCNGSFMKRVQCGQYDGNQCWFDGMGKMYALFPVMNEAATSIQHQRLGKFSALSVGALKRVALKDYLPEDSLVMLKSVIREDSVLVAIKVFLLLVFIYGRKNKIVQLVRNPTNVRNSLLRFLVLL